MELARIVRRAAVAADGLDGFVAEVEAAGCMVKVRRAPSGDPLGYAVARNGDVTASGEPVSYSGSKLAPDLSLPRLMRRWDGAGSRAAAGDPVRAARREVQRARAAMVAARGGGAATPPGAIAEAAAEVLTAMRGWADELDAAAETYDRAARLPRAEPSEAGSAAIRLRRVARQLIRSRHATRSWDDPATGGIALAVAMTALVREIAAWQRERGQPHQAAAAAAAASAVQSWVDSTGVEPAAVADHASATLQQRLDRRGPAVLGPRP